MVYGFVVQDKARYGKVGGFGPRLVVRRSHQVLEILPNPRLFLTPVDRTIRI